MIESKEKIKVGFYQFPVNEKDLRKNFFLIENFFSGDSAENLDLLILPELFSSGFNYAVLDEAIALNREIDLYLRKVAEEKKINIAASLLQSLDGNYYNSFALWQPAKDTVFPYSKIHLFPYLDEPKYFSPGKIRATINLDGWRWGAAICYDLRFPELFSAYVRRDRVDGFLVPAQWPKTRLEHWTTLLRARAIESQSFLLAVNSCGNGLAGNSMLVHANGDILLQAKDEEIFLSTEINLKELREWRSIFPSINQWKSPEIYSSS